MGFSVLIPLLEKAATGIPIMNWELPFAAIGAGDDRAIVLSSRASLRDRDLRK